MSKTHSPTHFNGDIDNFYDPNFPADVNARMRVPKSIRVNGDYPNVDIAVNRAMWNQIPAMEKLEMHVPDRILVVGKALFQTIGLFHFLLQRYFTILARLRFNFFHFTHLSIAGQEQHVGTKAPPPEIVLENAVMRTEPAIVRVQVIYYKSYKLAAHP